MIPFFHTWYFHNSFIWGFEVFISFHVILFRRILSFSRENSWLVYFHMQRSVINLFSQNCFCVVWLLAHVTFSRLIHFLMWFLSEQEDSVWRAVCVRQERGEQCTMYDGDCTVPMCSVMWSVQVCSLLPLCVALVILSDSNISVVVSLHPPEPRFHRLCCWYGGACTQHEVNKIDCAAEKKLT